MWSSLNSRKYVLLETLVPMFRGLTLRQYVQATLNYRQPYFLMYVLLFLLDADSLSTPQLHRAFVLFDHIPAARRVSQPYYGTTGQTLHQWIIFGHQTAHRWEPYRT